MHAEHDLDLEETPFSRQSGGTVPSPVVEAAERLKQAAGENAKRLRSAAEAGFRTFKEAAPESTADSSAVAAPNWDELRAKAKELHREGEAWARENPTAAVAIAAGAGFVLGMLLKR
jgi:ElaB/YqjD/DUF883 family membrane-anchored ribosome-binding protein